jgi:hypothetical protein
MALPTISALPVLPNLSDDPESFTEDADRFFAGLPIYRTEMNALATAIDAVTVQIDSSVDLAIDAKNDALDAKTAAEAASASAFASANLTNYNSGSTYAAGQMALGSNGVVYRAVQAVPAGDNPVTSTSGRWVKALSVDQVDGITAAGKTLVTATTLDAQKTILGISSTSSIEERDGTTEIGYDAQGLVARVRTVFNDGDEIIVYYNYNADGTVSYIVENYYDSVSTVEAKRTTYQYLNGKLSSWTVNMGN